MAIIVGSAFVALLHTKCIVMTALFLVSVYMDVWLSPPTTDLRDSWMLRPWPDSMM